MKYYWVERGMSLNKERVERKKEGKKEGRIDLLRQTGFTALLCLSSM
jgi:hypothetical protein